MLFKTIAAYVRSSPILFSLIAAGGLFELLFHYLSALSYKYLIDKALIPKDAKVLAIIVGALLLIGLLNVLFGIAGDYAKAKLGSKMVFEYRIKLFKHMQMQSHRFYEKFRLGDLLARYTEDIPAIQLATIQTLSSGLVSVLSVIVGLAILFSTEWRLTMIVIGGSALLFLPYRLLKARSLQLNEAYLSELGQFTGSIDENIKSYKVIRGFNLGQTMLARVENHLRTMLSIGVRRNFVNSNLNRLPLLAISILGAIVLGYGSYLTFDGSLSIGSFIAYNSIFIMVGQSLFGVTALIPAILASRTSIQRFQAVLDWRPDVEEQGRLELREVRREISLQGVSFGYHPGELVLRQLDLSIPATGYTSIVGASGSGKSTVLQLLLRFEDPTGGAVFYDDENIRHVDYASLLRQVGIVFQDSILLRGTIRDNILVGKPDAEEREIEEAAKAAGIHDAIVGFQDGYDTMIHGQGDNLSGGQRQRIALARALIRKPRILFLDEATSALDPETERSVNETILSLARNRAVVSVTHRLAYAAMSDQIIVLDKGQVAESGPHDELMQGHGLYRRMWDKQQGFVLTKGGNVHVEWNRLGQMPFFGGLEPDALQEISQSFATERFEAGVLVVEQGDEGDKFYIIVRGTVDVLIRDAETGESRKVAALEDGDHFGEIALMYNVPRSASIVTQSPCICLALSREDFHPLMTRFPSIREALEATLRIRNQRSAAQ
ncbi:ABC transporter transmembrane domain-containing protein [Paenibacillus sp. N3.4]|uniref:ABC transporter transmembrane domain-containing protein n=1 Tax=Paenibacillus sp. N3.4 TaxID=2603222 RepID=UPI0011CC771D|nr:ABC transporter transmembrane domain-containing protein [Paenibacillus sp. N3.4]TXK83534.1 ATP-binding cassette domain-containing protein [Paenibacillus sp. N3.4]